VKDFSRINPRSGCLLYSLFFVLYALLGNSKEYRVESKEHRGGIAYGDTFVKDFLQINPRSGCLLYSLFFVLYALKKS
jgi:hypothetical protein